MRAAWLAGAACAALAGCGGADSQRKPRPDWVVRSQVVFLSPDFSSARPREPLDALRLWFPYVSGDLYGSPTVAALVDPSLDADYRFELDLNRSHEGLLQALEPTNFSMSWLKIVPQEARIARLLPFVMQSDGIEPVGSAEWLDAGSKQRLMLLYVDRPARIMGATRAGRRTLRFDIRAEQPGYVWIGQSSNEAAETYAVVARPGRILLAVTQP